MKADMSLYASCSPFSAPRLNLRLAKVGYERMQEMADPSRSLERTREIRQNTDVAKNGFSNA